MLARGHGSPPFVAALAWETVSVSSSRCEGNRCAASCRGGLQTTAFIGRVAKYGNAASRRTRQGVRESRTSGRHVLLDSGWAFEPGGSSDKHSRITHSAHWPSLGQASRGLLTDKRRGQMEVFVQRDASHVVVSCLVSMERCD